MEAPVVHTHTGVSGTEKAATESQLLDRLSTLESNNSQYLGLAARLEEALCRLDGGGQNEEDPKPSEVPQGALTRFDLALEKQQATLELLSDAVTRLERII